MDCCICVNVIDPLFISKLSNCKHFFCQQCSVDLVSKKCLLCNNKHIATLSNANILFAHYERFIHSDDFSTRVYNLNINNKNFNYPSVTSITTIVGYVGFKIYREKRIKEIGIGQYAKESKAITDRGTLVHLVIEKFLKDPKNYDIFCEGLMAGSIVQSMMVYLKEIKSIILQESIVFSHELKIMGQVDCVGYFNKKLSVIDFKTSIKRKTKSTTIAYFHQCAAYAACFEESTGKKIEQLVLIIGIVNENQSQVVIKPFTIKDVDCLKALRIKFFDIFSI